MWNHQVELVTKRPHEGEHKKWQPAQSKSAHDDTQRRRRLKEKQSKKKKKIQRSKF
jgi:hypothetical protein